MIGQAKPNVDDNIKEKEPTEKKKLFNFDFHFLNKLKNIKGIKIIVPIILICVIVLIYYSFFSSSSSSKTSSTSSSLYTSSLEYCDILESKLENILSNIKGAGSVSVMVTLESSPELKIATETDERTTTTTSSTGSTSSVTVVEEPVIITVDGEDSPLVLMEILPVVKGIIVVAEGASNVSVKLQLLEAIQALLEIKSSNIQIFTGI